MADITDADPQQQFARAFGNALKRYFDGLGKGSTEAAALLGLQQKNGKNRLNSYFYDSSTGRRTEASAQILYLACTRLPRFAFEYAGYRISAIKVKGRSGKESVNQIPFAFDRQFSLAMDAGNVNVKVKRPSGKIELRVSLDAKAS
jgi:hypothetical protein